MAKGYKSGKGYSRKDWDAVADNPKLSDEQLAKAGPKATRNKTSAITSQTATRSITATSAAANAEMVAEDMDIDNRHPLVGGCTRNPRWGLSPLRNLLRDDS